MKALKITAIAICALSACTVLASDYVSKVWVADNGDGTYTNPVINADYSDPDVVAVGGDYYMTSSSFCNVPALPILHSRDLVNWQLVNYAVKELPTRYNITRHGDGVWAPAIRYHNGEFFIFWGDPDMGIYMVRTKDPLGRWDKPVLVKQAKGIIDTCPLWDEDGRAYLVNGWAKSRSGLNAILTVTEMSPDGTSLIGDPVMVYDGIPDGNHTIEGPKFYKRGDWYYIFAPAGSVTTGWQVVLRSKSPYGPYEARTVMTQGNTDINGPHQGGWVDTPEGESWFLHFQDKGIIGRVTHLNPMTWTDGWPVIGIDTDGDGCGHPVRTHAKPKVAVQQPITTPVEDDEFSTTALGLQWEWFANYKPTFGQPTPYGYYRIYGHALSPKFLNMREVPNILTQKFPNDSFTATAKVTVSGTADGQQSGLIVMGYDYCRLTVEKQDSDFVIKQIICRDSHKSKGESAVTIATFPADRINGQGARRAFSIDLYLRVKVNPQGLCTFSYSRNNKRYIDCGSPFQARQGHWIGARVGFFSIQPRGVNRGWIDLDWFRITPYR